MTYFDPLLNLNFQVALFYRQSFQVTGHFETTAQNDPKMTLNTIRASVYTPNMGYY